MNGLELTEPIIENVSPYDVSYPMTLLSNELKSELSRTQTIAGEIYQTIINEMPIVTQVQQAFQTNCRYVVDISDSTIKAIENFQKAGNLFGIATGRRLKSLEPMLIKYKIQP